ncbi:MAG: D-alanyl-D-alanine carboxypeptidase [Gammaproteobacteria bacterium]|nr:D-alanyl-D-alanine carboxypeptidase [Gammaproteobacteria bacterium]
MKKTLRQALITLFTLMVVVITVSTATAAAQQATQATADKKSSVAVTSAQSAPSAKNVQSTQQPTPDKKSPANSNFIPPAPQISSAAYVLMDANSGKILAQKNSASIREPASLTKLMTLYVTFNAIKQGLIKQDDKALISKKAWKTGGSKMFVKAGNKVSVDKLIQGVIVDSGNDASMALAEYVGGSEQGFVTMMNQQAKVLGMTQTHFTDPTGLPASDHVTTAADLAILTRALINRFPQQYRHFSQKWLTYSGIRQPNRNRLLWCYPGADGLKTGHTKAAGFCLIASAQHNGMRLISVVLGSASDEVRTNDSIALMRYGFRFFDSYRLYQANTPIAQLRVWYGKAKKLPVGVSKDLFITVPHGQLKQIKIVLQSSTLEAPIKAAQPVGKIAVTLQGNQIAKVPAVALKADAKGGLFRHLIDGAHSKLAGKKGVTSIPLTIPENIRAPNPILVQTPATTATSTSKRDAKQP